MHNSGGTKPVKQHEFFVCLITFFSVTFFMFSFSSTASASSDDHSSDDVVVVSGICVRRGRIIRIAESSDDCRKREQFYKVEGPAGADGVDGINGINGIDGAPGRDGIDGAPGRNGVDGKDGTPGRNGVDGKDGVDGADGQDGAPGLDGVAGAPGKDGVDGVDGAPGKDGVDGVDGAPGKDGVDGVDGAPGRDGVDGVDGAPGRDGVDGADGAPGRDGVDGVDGAPGRDGVDGVDGAPGRDGVDGVDGAPGRDGVDGVDGAPGRDGVDGVDGADGAPGLDGVDRTLDICILYSYVPAAPAPDYCGVMADRYVDQGNGTVLDNNTGLIWMKDASCRDLANTNGVGRATWDNANAAAAALSDGTCGLTDGSQAGDWRLPTVTEFCSAWTTIAPLELGVPFACPAAAASDSMINGTLAPPPVGNPSDPTPGAPFDEVETAGYWTATEFDADNAWAVTLSNTNVVSGGKVNRNFAWLVRAGQ